MYRRDIISWLTLWAITISSFILLKGCSSESLEQEQEAVSKALNVKVGSRGSHNEVVMVSQDSTIVKRIKPYFEMPFSPLGPIEPRITVYYTKDINNDLKRFRQIIVLKRKDDNNIPEGLKQLSDTMQHDCRIVTFRDVWSAPQWVYVVLLPEEIGQECIEHIGNTLVPKIDSLELSHLQKVIARSHRAKEIEVLLENAFGIKTTIPINFSVARQSDSIIWVRSDEADIVHSLIFARIKNTKFPEKPQDFMLLREKVLRFVPGATPGDYVTTDTIIDFLKHDGLLVVRGLWKMKKQFMGGLFVAYVRLLSDGSLLYIEGFLYAPGEEKRFKIRWLEAIIRNTSFAHE